MDSFDLFLTVGDSFICDTSSECSKKCKERRIELKKSSESSICCGSQTESFSWDDEIICDNFDIIVSNSLTCSFKAAFSRLSLRASD